MSTLAIQSNESSGLLRTLTSAKTEDYSYNIEASVPLLVPSQVELSPNQSISGAPEGKSMTFNLNKNQLWTGAEIRTVISRAVGAVASVKPWGLTLFESIEIKSNNKTIMTLSDSAIRAIVSTMPDEQKQAVLRRATPMNANGAVLTTAGAISTATTVVVYTPVMAIFFEAMNTHLDLSFVEQIQIVCKFNTVNGIGSGAAFTSVESTLWCYQYITDNMYLSFLRSKNYARGSFLNMLSWNTYKEVQDIASTTATSTIFKMHVNYPVRAIHFAIVKTDTAGTTSTNTDLSPIYNITLEFGGQKLIDTCPYLSVNRVKELQGASATTLLPSGGYSGNVARADTDWVTIPFAMQLLDRTYNSGAVSFNDLNSPILTLSHAATGVAAQLQVVYEYFNMLSISDAGIVSISQSY